MNSGLLPQSATCSVHVCRASCFVLFVAGLFSLAASAARAADERPPNIILIVADDLGWADLNCYGSKYHRTPELDRLAREGMRFTQAYAACPVCSPTRAALMTGKYPARLHLTDWLPGRADQPAQRMLRPPFRQELPLEEVTLAERLRDAGYATAHIGKWHLGGAGFEPQKQGFDINIAGNPAGSTRSYFAPFRRDGQFFPGLDEAPEGEYLTDRLSAEAEKFIEHNRDRPFFLYLPHFAVHTPLQAKPDIVDRYKEQPRPALPQNNPTYAAMLESLDEGVGRVMKKLDDTKIADRTVVIFTSDNGGLATIEGDKTPSTSNAPLREGKGYLYEGGIRVPLLVRWPGSVRAASTCDVPVSSIDLVPTICEIVGRPPEKAQVDGVSVVPLLKQTGPLEPRPLFWHYPHYSNQGGRPGGAIRDGNDKLIEFYDTGRTELFDVQNDSGEGTNLIEKFPEKAAQLAARLRAWRQSVAAQDMRPNPDYHPNPPAKDGSITLAAKSADVHGVMLRFEPLPHKNTLGYWVRPDDWASWEFEATKPGEFRVEILQGCGTGSGGSEVEFAVGEQKLLVTVEDTGGFQKFVRREIGTLKLDQPGRHTLTVKPLKKPGVAVMDLREVKLVPK
ncbi:MAG: sulfatase-like hydrolase/transferase [Planctomycetia bacterium]|nr:sulfatase-like hydrolase/transferase [Planctomycetia bacterium]